MTEKRQWGLRSSILRRGVFLLALLAMAGLAALTVWLIGLDQGIKTRFAEKRFAPPVEFYSAPESIEVGARYPRDYFEGIFARKNFRRREFGQPIQPGDVSVWTGDQCRSILPQAAPTAVVPSDDNTNGLGSSPSAPHPMLVAPEAPAIARCIAFRNHASETNTPATEDASTQVQIIALDPESRVSSLAAGAPPQTVAQVEIEPELFAQYYGDKPVLRTVVSLGEVPTNCLNGLLAIEDSKFLEHPGISITGLGRAVLTVLRPGQRAQGGSTITQQLVKNYFLTDERTLSRKVTEMAMALMVERHATKDEILETYINLIYMGQNGPFQVRGFAAASEHYFGKPIADLGLEQCSLLVGILNNPGYFNPFHYPAHAAARRAKVIDRMLDLKMIDAEQARQAKAAPLPARPQRSLTEPAPYFVQAVRRELSTRGIDESEGLRVYTTLNLRAQETAHQVVRAGLDRLESTIPHIQKLKAQGKTLEAVFLSADPRTGAVQALVGGRGYLVTQFNRAIDSHRQVGSVMKPFTYLTALESNAPDGKPYTPLSILQDKLTTHKFDGQSWTPHNYEGTFNGDVPMFWALQESLNAATANLGISVGLNNVIDTAHRLGITSRIDPVPSLTLGAFEISPMEVLQAYSAIANLGTRVPLTLLRRIDTPTGRELYRYDGRPEAVAPPQETAELIGIMKQTIENGTGRGARLAGFTSPAAGKTGTTNDKKDAWFAGFTPYHAAVVWVGYDDNTSHNLTGATGAVPIWTDYMKQYASHFPPDDFKWPEGVDRVELSPEQQLAFGVPARTEAHLAPIQLIFKKGLAPAASANDINRPPGI